MNLGESLLNARKSKGLTQEAVAEKLGVSRQTVSKWETGETLPDIRQSKRLAALYRLLKPSGYALRLAPFPAGEDIHAVEPGFRDAA